MHIGIVIIRKSTGSPTDYGQLNIDDVTDALLTASCKSVRRMYTNLGGTDTVAKGPELRKRVLVSAQRAARS